MICMGALDIKNYLLYDSIHMLNAPKALSVDAVKAFSQSEVDRELLLPFYALFSDVAKYKYLITASTFFS